MSTASLAQINLYPVKSLGGLAVSNAWVEKQGLVFDRRFMLKDRAGNMITARKYPVLVTVRCTLIQDGLVFTAAEQLPFTLKYADLQRQETEATVWRDTFIAYSTTDAANQWFSQLLGLEVTLLYCGEQSNRVREPVGHSVSFADGYPLLVISQASLDELNRRSPVLHSMDQFRTNLVVRSNEPFVEDSWKRIRIGAVEFEIAKPCERCILTTIDVETAEFRPTKEPLRTLSEFRADEQGRVFFGQNLIAKNEGIIQVGDPIEVLEYKEKEFYADKAEQPTADNPFVAVTSVGRKALTLTVDGQSFTGDNQISLLLQAENVGITIPNSCRAGLCGACRVKVVSGEVAQEDSPVLSALADDMALACCCVPQTDLVIER